MEKKTQMVSESNQSHSYQRNANPSSSAMQGIFGGELLIKLKNVFLENWGAGKAGVRWKLLPLVTYSFKKEALFGVP